MVPSSDLPRRFTAGTATQRQIKEGQVALNELTLLLNGTPFNEVLHRQKPNPLPLDQRRILIQHILQPKDHHITLIYNPQNKKRRRP